MASWRRHDPCSFEFCRLKKMEAERMQEASGENLDKEAKAKKKKCALCLPSRIAIVFSLHFPVKYIHEM